MNSSFAVSCNQVTKRFGSGSTGTLALRGADVDVPFGGITMLVGPSGCGKTTLLSIIAGLLEPTSGEVRVLGQSPTELNATDRVLFRRHNMGFIFQQYNLLPSLTTAENAAVALLAAGVARSEAVARASVVLDQLGLGNKLDSLPSQLSGGQQQRVAIARALVHEPRIILCDEPTAALDAKSGHAVMEMLSGVAVHPDRGVVIVTHDSRIFDFADRIVHMEDGQITQIQENAEAGEPNDELNDDDRLLAAAQ
jgi:putative ABC transport system ATP-binding protein